MDVTYKVLERTEIKFIVAKTTGNVNISSFNRSSGLFYV